MDMKNNHLGEEFDIAENLYLDEEFDVTEESFPEKDRTRRAKRRKNTWKKIKKVQDIARTSSLSSPVADEMLLGHRAAKRNPLKYYVRRRKTSEKNTLARSERMCDALREDYEAA